MKAKFNQEACRQSLTPTDLKVIKKITSWFEVKQLSPELYELPPEIDKKFPIRAHQNAMHVRFLTFQTPLDIIKERLK